MLSFLFDTAPGLQGRRQYNNIQRAWGVPRCDQPVVWKVPHSEVRRARACPTTLPKARVKLLLTPACRALR